MSFNPYASSPLPRESRRRTPPPGARRPTKLGPLYWKDTERTLRNADAAARLAEQGPNWDPNHEKIVAQDLVRPKYKHIYRDQFGVLVTKITWEPDPAGHARLAAREDRRNDPNAGKSTVRRRKADPTSPVKVATVATPGLRPGDTVTVRIEGEDCQVTVGTGTPLGRALLGRTVGATVTYDAPGGTMSAIII